MAAESGRAGVGGVARPTGEPEDVQGIETLLPLPQLAFQVLLALAAGHNHGYGIAKEIELNTGGRTRPGTGSLYLSMAKLKDQTLIEPCDPPPSTGRSDARRRYYRLTTAGRAAAAAEGRRLARLVRLARQRDLLTAGEEAC